MAKKLNKQKGSMLLRTFVYLIRIYPAWLSAVLTKSARKPWAFEIRPVRSSMEAGRLAPGSFPRGSASQRQNHAQPGVWTPVQTIDMTESKLVVMASWAHRVHPRSTSLPRPTFASHMSPSQFLPHIPTSHMPLPTSHVPPHTTCPTSRRPTPETSHLPRLTSHTPPATFCLRIPPPMFHVLRSSSREPLVWL